MMPEPYAPDREAPRSPTRRPLIAAALSFVFPGIGQAVAGAPLRGLAVASAPLVIVAGVAAIVVLDRHLLVQAALDPTVLLGIVVASLLLLVYRLWAIVDAYAVARASGVARPPARGFEALSLAGLILLLVATVGTHAWVAGVGLSARETLIAVFDPNGPRGLPSGSAPVASASSERASLAPSADATATPAPTGPPTPSPTPTPAWAADGRLNVLLIGSDAGPGRWSMRADAIILLSVEIDTGRIAAFSVPRYTRNVPLPEPAASAFACGCLADDYFNALYVYANQHPDLFPGDDEATRGLSALSGAAEAFFGVQLDGMAVADLNGFMRLVDAIGGLTIDVPEPIHDEDYPNPDGSGTIVLDIPAGRQHLDGWHALAYARTRHQDSDVARMYRQQLVVQSMKHDIGCDIVGKLPAILEVARDALWTNLRLEDVPEMLTIDPGPVESHVLFDDYNVTLTPEDVARVQDLVAHAFDGPRPPDDPDPDC